MSEIKILQLSDLHLDSSNTKDPQIILNALWKDLDNFKGIDLILFTGDLVRAGDTKESFDKAFRTFIEPLLNNTNVNKDNFFLVPGNHEVQLKAVNRYLEKGLEKELVDTKSINSFIDDEIENGFINIERLDHYNDFKTNVIGSSHVVTSNKLYSTHVVEKNSTKIGIACLNSAWRSAGKGGSHDNGKMLIGERQVYECLQDIGNCDIKIAIHHHPLDWLTEEDKNDTEEILFREFDFIFCGHLHQSNLKNIKNLESEIVIIQGGSLYQGRSHYNGYSVLSIDAQKGKGILYLRTYFDGRKKFDKAFDRCENGEISIGIKKKKVIVNGIDGNGTEYEFENIILKNFPEYIEPEIIETMKIEELPFTDEIFSLKSMSDKKIKKIETETYNSYLENPTLFYANLTSCYLISRKLFEDIKGNNFESCNHTFIYPIHQYLSEKIRKSDEKDHIEDILIKWVIDKENIPPTTRDFATFELGMSNAENAVDVLLMLLKHEYELPPIRNYAAMALGMIMKKNDKRLKNLLDLSFKETDLEIKKSLINAIIFIQKYKEEN